MLNFCFEFQSLIFEPKKMFMAIICTTDREMNKSRV